MKIAFFDTHRFDREAFQKENLRFKHDLVFMETHLSAQTTSLAAGYPGICVFVNDHLDRDTLKIICKNGTRLIALRSAGFNNVDLRTASECGCTVVRVPEYSPYAVAEHAVALILALNRKTHRAYNRVRDGNFSIEGLVGFDLYRKTVGIIGTGKIGRAFASIMLGFGCRVLAYDTIKNDNLQARGITYTPLETVFRDSAIISLHVPLTPETRHIIDGRTLALTQPGVVLINTGRGGLIDTPALIDSLKSGHIGAAGLDVYEEEEGIFFADHSGEILQDDHLARLMTFPNVLITSHQAFLTAEALANIAQTTLENISSFEAGEKLINEIRFTETAWNQK